METHLLNDKWNLFYHLPDDKSWNLNSYKIILKNINNTETVVALNNNVSDKIIKYSMLFLFRANIAPMWEDPANAKGGSFSFKVYNSKVVSIWKLLVCSLVGETLCIDNENIKLVNGITISPKRKFCIIKIWMKNCLFQDPNILINIPGLTNEGCLFRKHEADF
jgi:translation initiation factor 4E